MNDARGYFDRQGKGLLARLHASGHAPPQCREVTLQFPTDGALEIVYRCHLTDELMGIIGKDFMSAALRSEDAAASRAKTEGGGE